MSDTASNDFLGRPRRTSGEFLGHPRGLYVLFFTELWERFSFYGMKTLLMLYMINHFFWSQERASDLLGWYTFFAYGLPVVGGFIADRYLGAKRAVMLGAVLLSAGHLTMTIETKTCFYTALALIIAGVGLLKPNVSTQVGSLYKPDDPRRDGAFTIFYMGINLGAFAGPLLCDWLRAHFGYAYGFGAAGIGMILGLVVYVIGQRKLVEFNQDQPAEDGQTRARAEARPAHPPHVVRDRIIVLLVVFAFIILFWTAFEQSPNAMLVWADKHTNLQVFTTEPPPIELPGAETSAEIELSENSGGFAVTSGQTQSFNPFFIITVAPIFAFMWMWLDRRKLQPSTPTKMFLGLVGVALAFGVMWPAAHSENGNSSVSLASLPALFQVDENGAVYAPDSEDAEERVYYGASRLHYDADGKTLQMSGVLPDLDRLRLLAGSAPPDFRVAAAEAVKRSREEASAAKLGEGFEFSQTLTDFPAGLQLAGDEVVKMVAWDADTRTLTVTDEINGRAEVELLAAGAQPDFKTAVDQIYLDSAQYRVSVWWLIGFYLVLTMGELCLSPVGLSLVTKLAPARHVGLFMGGWFLATAVAEKLAQVFGAYWGKMPPGNYFLIFVVMCAVGAVFMALLVPPLKRMMHGVH